MPTFALNFSRPGGADHRAVLQLHPATAARATAASSRPAPTRHSSSPAKLPAMGPFDMLYDGTGGLPAVAYTLKDRPAPASRSTICRIACACAAGRSPSYPLPANRQDTVVQRILVRHGVSRDMAALLADDIRRAIALLRRTHPASPQTAEHRERITTTDPMIRDFFKFLGRSGVRHAVPGPGLRPPARPRQARVLLARLDGRRAAGGARRRRRSRSAWPACTSRSRTCSRRSSSRSSPTPSACASGRSSSRACAGGRPARRARAGHDDGRVRDGVWAAAGCSAWPRVRGRHPVGQQHDQRGDGRGHGRRGQGSTPCRRG